MKRIVNVRAKSLSRLLAFLSFVWFAVFANGLASAQCPFLISGLPSASGTSDGLLFIRTAQQIAASELTKATGTVLSGTDIQSSVSSSLAQIDLNDSGRFDLFDASMIVRYLLGFRGDGLVPGGAGPDAQRKKGNDIQKYIDGGCVPTRYSVGGPIEGLTTNGLVLQINTADTLSVPANATSFTMPILLRPGDTYEVRVKTQPDGLNCNVFKATGMIGEANVTNVTVICVPRTYTIGGTISGLNNAGLVLQNNGGDATSIPAGATSFAMTTALQSGSAYQITVGTQPTGLNCTVTNGSGVVAGANVTNIQITCVFASYTVGGTVSGLAATGLVLQNNGTGSTAIPANATSFTMPGSFFPDSPYAITILTQPNGHSCTVTNGSGTVALANVTNVQISCIRLYTIGGNVEFLRDAAGLILRNNGGDATQIPANSTSFTMATPLVAGSSYAITIFSQPLGRVCTLSNGNGVVGTANVTNVQVSCCNTVAPPGTPPQQLPSGGRTRVGYSGVCDASCSSACSSFNFDCCSNELLYAGACTNNGGGAGVALCECTCR
jgi:hypothetical protein